jgi:SAM-dependent methyltransferase
MEPHYRALNRQAWSQLARNHCESSRPYGPREFRRARAYLDSRDWIPWNEVRHVLCLAAGGGQQAPLFASLGYRVVSADLSPEQLQRDQRTAQRFGLHIECVAADMLDLSSLHGREFDLVYQAVSSCYVPDIARLYREVARVLGPRGYYYAEHWNPAHLQLATPQAWTGSGYLLSKPLSAGTPLEWPLPDARGAAPQGRCVHYMHSLTELIGCLGETGFHILRFAERQAASAQAQPGSDAHLAAYLPPFFSLFTRRCENGPTATD